MANPLLVGSLVVALASPEDASRPLAVPQAPASKGEHPLFSPAFGRGTERNGFNQSCVLARRGERRRTTPP
jgi:hypothetical protein